MQELVLLLAGALTATALTAGYFLMTSPVQFIRQVYIFQLFRPVDGTSGVVPRVAEVLGYAGSHLTIYVALAGLGIWLLRGVVQRDWGQWSLIVVWGLAVVLLIIASRTFYPHYVVQLAVPLSLLAGAVVSQRRSGTAASPAASRHARFGRFDQPERGNGRVCCSPKGRDVSFTRTARRQSLSRNPDAGRGPSPGLSTGIRLCGLASTCHTGRRRLFD